MANKIAVIGTGYVGLVTAACFSKLGNVNVVCVDVVSSKVDMINRGESPIFEPGLDLSGVSATTDCQGAVDGADFIFICVGTPSAPSGAIDLKYIRSAAHDVGRALRKKKAKNDYPVIIVKSTVVPGTTENVVLPILEKESGLKGGRDFGISMNPEFLKEGSAVEDFMKADRVVIGAMDERSASLVNSLYDKINCPKMFTNPRTAEMIKYASNSFLATKISFINEVANLCEPLGIDIADVTRGMGLDSRISPHFLMAGAGFGGSCFSKDVKALISTAKSRKRNLSILETVLKVNDKQPLRMVELAKSALGGSLKGKRIAVLGLAFKEDTDDMRDAPSIPIINALLRLGARVAVHDPQAMENAKSVFGSKKVYYAASSSDALKGADCCMLVTKWGEYSRLDGEELKRLMKHPVVIDGRRVLPALGEKNSGITYRGIGFGGMI